MVTAFSPPTLWDRGSPPSERLLWRRLDLTHVGSAVLLALIAAPLITRTLGGVGRAPALELASRGLLVLIGLWLILRAWHGRRHPHGEGLAVGFIAGLVPCPLTLFAMCFALARGALEAGLAFAMMIGVLTTLAIVAILTVLTRASLLRLTRILDGASGALLIVLSVQHLARDIRQAERQWERPDRDNERKI